MGKVESIVKRFPGFYQSNEPDTVLKQFLQAVGAALDGAESDLIKVMRAHWVDSADNEDSQGFNTAQKGDLDRIFSLYLENLGGTSQIKQTGRRSGAEGEIDDAVYRDRIKGLISILKSGASTREGIVAIIAANLGVVGNTPEAAAAKQSIRVIEYLPEQVTTDTHPLKLLETFSVTNPNAVPVVPQVRVSVREDFEAPLMTPRIVNLSTGQAVQYGGTVKKGDMLSFFPDGTAMLNGEQVALDGPVPQLLPGKSQWRFEAVAGLSEGRYDQTLFEFSLFDEAREIPAGAIQLETAVDLALSFTKLTPAAFMVRIPWDIPGFTEKLDALPENPRNQIQYIVNKVKAAGVVSIIAYEKKFSEEQSLADLLTMQIPRREDHAVEEGNFDIGSVQVPYPGGIVHELSDNLITSGMFDVTGFDTLNTFA